MTITNRIENGIIAAVAMIITVIIFGLYNHLFVLKPLQNELKAQRESIIRLAEIPKYSIDNDFGKMKAKDGQVNLHLENDMDIIKRNLDEQLLKDSISNNGFLKRIFGRK